MNRKSNIELLRIVLLLMVCLIHSTCNQIVTPPYDSNCSSYLSLLLIYVLSRPAVDCFVIITGYFCINKELPLGLNLGAHKKVYVPLLWCIPIIALYILIFHMERGIVNSAATTLLSFFRLRDLFGHLWYIVGYFWILLLAPFLNRQVVNLTKKQYRYFIILLSLLLVTISSINDFFGQRILYGYTFNSYSEQDSYNIILFIPLYFIGGYIAKYNIHSRLPFLKFVILGIIVAGLTYVYSQTGGIMSLGKKMMGREVNSVFTFYEAFCKYNNIFILLMAYYLFMSFNQIDIRSKVINRIAKGSYTGYLIHIVLLSIIYYAICNIAETVAYYPFYTVKSFPLYYHIIIGIVCGVISLLIGVGIDKLIGYKFKN